MRIFVTGAGGFVGAAVVRAALAARHAVTGTVRPGGDASRLADLPAGLQIAALDLRDRDAVAGAVATARPDVVVHIAWSGVDHASRGDRLQIADNIDSSLALLDAAAAAGARKFVGLGSQGEYGALGGRIGEAALPEPASLYGAAKLAVMHLTRQLAGQAGLSFAWMRLFSTYGPGDKPHWLIPSMIETMLAGDRPRTTPGTQLWDYLHIDDVARGVLAVAATPEATGIFNLGSGRPVPVRAIVEQIRDLAAPGLDLVFGEMPFGPNQIMHMEADVTRLGALGWAPQVDLADGLAATIAWHRQRRRSSVAEPAHA